MTQAERAEIINKRLEDTIRKSIEKYHFSGQSCQEAKDDIQNIFSLYETEAEEHMVKYWGRQIHSAQIFKRISGTMTAPLPISIPDRSIRANSPGRFIWRDRNLQ